MSVSYDRPKSEMYIWVIDQAMLVIDQARGHVGCILVTFGFACLWTKAKSKSIHTQNKRSRPVFNRLPKTSLIGQLTINYMA